MVCMTHRWRETDSNLRSSFQVQITRLRTQRAVLESLRPGRLPDLVCRTGESEKAGSERHDIRWDTDERCPQVVKAAAVVRCRFILRTLVGELFHSGFAVGAQRISAHAVCW